MNGFNPEMHDPYAIEEARKEWRGMHRGTVRGKTFEKSRRNRKRTAKTP